MKPSIPKILNTSTLAQSRLFKVESVHLRFSNGQERHYERLLNRNGESVIVMGILEDTLVLIREYSVGVEGYTLGFPKGIIDAGENPESAANRELQEEAGFGAKDLKVATKLTLNPGYSNMGSYLVIAQDLYPATAPGDEPEPLEVVRWPLADIAGLLAHPEFHEARSIAALMWLPR